MRKFEGRYFTRGVENTNMTLTTSKDESKGLVSLQLLGPWSEYSAFGFQVRRNIIVIQDNLSSYLVYVAQKTQVYHSTRLAGRWGFPKPINQAWGQWARQELWDKQLQKKFLGTHERTVRKGKDYLQDYVLSTKYLHMQSTELCLASSKLLTPLFTTEQAEC